MNKIQRPDHDDDLAIQALANNRRLASFPNLLPVLNEIRQGYAQYNNVAGNAFNVAPVALTPAQRDFLKAHYQSPPTALDHITHMRLSTEFRACPMCGSLHAGTLDHVLPQSTHGAFSIFSSNLVPACKCNSKRGSDLVGLHPGERILHPYFDQCLADRLLAARFDDLGEIPRISIRLIAGPAHPEYAAISFHADTIVRRTGILGWLGHRWSTMWRRPSTVIPTLNSIPVDQNALAGILQTELDRLDDLNGGKNNWESVFVMGLLDAPVTNWLFQCLTQPGRNPDGALGMR